METYNRDESAQTSMIVVNDEDDDDNNNNNKLSLRLSSSSFPSSSSASPSPSSSTPTSPRPASSSSFASLKSVLLTIFIFLITMIFVIYYAKNLLSILEKIKEMGTAGNLIFIASYIPTGLPFSLMSYYIPLTLSSGFMYGYIVGTITTMCGSVLSAWIGFNIARRFCRAWLEGKIRASARLSALLNALELHSVKVTLIMRLLPIPFGWQNGLCAMTSISDTKFVLASAVGLLPENCLLIYFGYNLTSISDLTSSDSSSSYHKILLGVAVVVGIIAFLAGRKLLKSTMALGDGYKKVEVEMDSMASIEEGVNNVNTTTVEEGGDIRGTVNERERAEEGRDRRGSEEEAGEHTLSKSGRLIQLREFSSPSRAGLTVNIKLNKAMADHHPAYVLEKERDQKHF